ncbi:MAG: hypothetical protein HFF05_02250 [Oscillospiraceae bacterium]|nr:hypothetical protein [Oscillospiraceae bacterium]
MKLKTCRTIQIILFAVLIASMFAVELAGGRYVETMACFGVAVVSGGALLVVHRFWKCPHCGARMGWKLAATECPKCKKKLED